MSRLVRDAPGVELTSARDATPSSAAFGLLIVVVASAVLWAALLGGVYLLFR